MVDQVKKGILLDWANFIDRIQLQKFQRMSYLVNISKSNNLKTRRKDKFFYYKEFYGGGKKMAVE